MHGPGPWGSARLPEEFACSVPSRFPLLPVARSALGRGGCRLWQAVSPGSSPLPGECPGCLAQGLRPFKPQRLHPDNGLCVLIFTARKGCKGLDDFLVGWPRRGQSGDTSPVLCVSEAQEPHRPPALTWGREAGHPPVPFPSWIHARKSELLPFLFAFLLESSLDQDR